ncbi:tRNA (N(6)-L-threonylcarbamoyladenosine(37)-C(2))-methylthiotransferase MtaB [Nitrospira moscoviensis]|uniref:Putative tRNA modifying enzyme, MiaB-like n=1 Tax=Nitrospira moscoviensis TaxID=42253 RepID=A0A0K2GCP2_NITMO|nr:tRNA (N(6)-L-threonylcarbamoyladenosine(37)-C(2))-methylthiotransferase MtaB [Nitrospira moscoviensis]ALA58725.1 putative tRNA modifying enzyme, MiaB-like [Nitrospira moscoviensis]
MATKRASLHTLGCRLNQAETSILGEGLRKQGYQLVAFGEPTDLLVLNTCSVTEDAERTSRYLIRKTLKHSPQAFVAVTGCYAQTGADALRRQAGVDLIVGHQYKMDLPAYLPPIDEIGKRNVPDVRHSRAMSREDFALPEYGESDSTRALLKIQDGCSAMCSFCIIPFARGHERSRLLDDVMREAETLTARGFKEIVLTGVNIGQYSQGEHDFCSLLRRLEHVPGLVRIRISSIEPTTVADELLDMMAASDKLCPYLHLPLQSGDDGMLTAMNRKHDVKAYVSLVERAMRMIPGLGLGTDLMVGFPGETEAAFANTAAVAADLPFSYLHVFSYSPRPGTAALRLNGRVAAAATKKRADLLREIGDRKRLAFHNKQIGITASVLFEQGLHDGYRCGTTPNFTRVAVAETEDLHNHIKPVTITAATDRWAIGHIPRPTQPDER